MLVFEERGKLESPEKNLSEQGQITNNRPDNPHIVLSLGIEPGPHWWEVSVLTTVPSLLPNLDLVIEEVGRDVKSSQAMLC